MKPTSLINPNLPTVTMPGMNPLIRFLAKSYKDIGRVVLRYGNRAQAEAKRQALTPFIMLDGSASAVVQVESRFLIAIFPAEYDFDQKSGRLIAKNPAKFPLRSELLKLGFENLGGGSFAVADLRRRPPFATVTGQRYNPRNRHNQNLPDDGPGLVYCQQVPMSHLETQVIANLGKRSGNCGPKTSASIARSRRQQYLAVSDRLNGRG